MGTFDAHAGAIGAGISEHCLVRVMGTSTCDIMVASRDVINNCQTLSGQSVKKCAFAHVRASYKYNNWFLHH